MAKKSSPVATPFAAIACLLPLLPVVLWPGTGVLASIALAGLGLLFFRTSRKPTLAMVWKSRVASILFGAAIGAAMAWGIANFVRPLVEGWLGKGVSIGGLDQVAGNPLFFAITLTIALGSAVVEELIFRGYVIGWGAQIFGTKFAPALMLLTTVVFGYAHWEYGPAGAVVTGFAGLVLGTLYLICGRRLLPCISAHMTFNLIGSVALYMA
ncbi:CPBP family intramembrane glutamic endopeptidase [Croceicoccus naphthovorans]|uniref:CPBP family intramembrane glutamic endopeptidase n=1 Tax=Croceicoccus naphthovorans TaxID=1348774 RepID=UPI00069F8BA9|nr:CPBP family intramembrane glutamic endopeptidase [Croceicoccus naphthovorans]MBB3990140.1 membrane protease YdiL (CAAX protease family) [Croceicoccus naphthovorans]